MSKITIIPLGTVSPYPKKNMNCPGFMIKYNNEKILLDCGNAITKLLKFPNDLNKLHVIITHYHNDHFGDIGSIQYASYVYHNLGLLDEKVKVFLPIKDFNFNKKSIVSNSESYSTYIDIDSDFKFYIDDLEISFKDNRSHTIASYMVKLQNKDFKIVYTSDIGITNFEDLIAFCKNADLIICESSLLKKHNSLNKTHMTASDAGTLAKLAKADKLLLTHFWPDENKKLYLKEAKRNFKNTEIAKEGKKLVLRRD